MIGFVPNESSARHTNHPKLVLLKPVVCCESLTKSGPQTAVVIGSQPCWDWTSSFFTNANQVAFGPYFDLICSSDDLPKVICLVIEDNRREANERNHLIFPHTSDDRVVGHVFTLVEVNLLRRVVTV